MITGRAYGLVDNKTGGVDKLDGTVDGTMDGFSSAFRVQIFWKTAKQASMTPRFSRPGRLDGIGYEKGSPNVRVPWHSDGVLKCFPPPPVVPKLPPFVEASQINGQGETGSAKAALYLRGPGDYSYARPSIRHRAVVVGWRTRIILTSR